MLLLNFPSRADSFVSGLPRTTTAASTDIVIINTNVANGPQSTRAITISDLSTLLSVQGSTNTLWTAAGTNINISYNGPGSTVTVSSASSAAYSGGVKSGVLIQTTNGAGTTTASIDATDGSVLAQSFKTNIVSKINTTARSKTNFADMQFVGGAAFGATADNSMVLGGTSNLASGVYSFVGGGNTNQATGFMATVVNGGWARAWGAFSFIGNSYFTSGGSIGNTADGQLSTIVNGEDNKAHGILSFIGSGNDAWALQIHSTVVNGSQVINNAPYAFLGGGQFNTIGTDIDDPNNPVNPGALYSVLVGGDTQTIHQSSTNSFIGGGHGNETSGNFNTIPGGFNNTITSSNAMALGSGLTTTTDNAVEVGTVDSKKTTFTGTNVTYRAPVSISNLTILNALTNKGASIYPYRGGGGLGAGAWTVVAGTGITKQMITNVTHVSVSGGSGDVTVTATPSIAVGAESQLLILEGSDDLARVILQDSGTLASSGLKLNATQRALSLGDSLILIYDSDAAQWEEVAFGGPDASGLTGLNASALGSGTVPTARLGIGSATANTLLHGNQSWSAVVEADQSLSDLTTANVSISKHGYTPKLPNDATMYLDGTGNYSVPPGGSGATAGTNISVSGTAVSVQQVLTNLVAVTNTGNIQSATFNATSQFNGSGAGLTSIPESGVTSLATDLSQRMTTNDTRVFTLTSGSVSNLVVGTNSVVQTTNAFEVYDTNGTLQVSVSDTNGVLSARAGGIFGGSGPSIFNGGISNNGASYFAGAITNAGFLRQSNDVYIDVAHALYPSNATASKVAVISSDRSLTNSGLGAVPINGDATATTAAQLNTAIGGEVLTNGHTHAFSLAASFSTTSSNLVGYAVGQGFAATTNKIIAGTVNLTNALSILVTNASFTWGQPINPDAAGITYQPPTVIVSNSAASAITMTLPTGWSYGVGSTNGILAGGVTAMTWARVPTIISNVTSVQWR